MSHFELPLSVKIPEEILLGLRHVLESHGWVENASEVASQLSSTARLLAFAAITVGFVAHVVESVVVDSALPLPA